MVGTVVEYGISHLDLLLRFGSLADGTLVYRNTERKMGQLFSLVHNGMTRGDNRR